MLAAVVYIHGHGLCTSVMTRTFGGMTSLGGFRFYFVWRVFFSFASSTHVVYSLVCEDHCLFSGLILLISPVWFKVNIPAAVEKLIPAWLTVRACSMSSD
jgi:hypothetical protein